MDSLNNASNNSSDSNNSNYGVNKKNVGQVIPGLPDRQDFYQIISPTQPKINKSFLGAVILVSILVLLGVGYIFVDNDVLKRRSSGGGGNGRPIPNISENVNKYEINDYEVIATWSGITFKVNKDWRVSITESSVNHSLVIAKTAGGEEIQMEVFSHSVINWEELAKNSLVRFTRSENREIGKNTVKVSYGSEQFGSSKRQIIEGQWNLGGKTAYLRVISPSESDLDQIFTEYSVNVGQEAGRQAGNSDWLVKTILAQDKIVPTLLPQIDYKLVEVMAEPLVEEVTKNDSQYKDGFAKGYRFLAFKTQRLAGYAEEDRNSNPNSFIRSQVFDRNGNPITSQMDTHTEFFAPYTGEYFMIVHTFGQQEGEYRFRIDDHEQLGCQAVIKYSDGAEHTRNHEIAADALVGGYEVGYIRQCPSTIKILDDTTIEHLVISRDPNISSYLKKWSVGVTSSPDLMKPKEGVEASFESVGTNSANTVSHDIEIKQLNSNRVIITPKSKLFDKNRQYFVQEWGDRFFTQDKLSASDLPIINNLSETFLEDFSPVEGQYGPELVEFVYIDWNDENLVTKELVAAQLTYRKEIINSDVEQRKADLDQLANKYINFLLSRGYVRSEANTYTDDSVSIANLWRIKKVTGLENGQTVCKVIVDNGKVTPTIYCSVNS